MSKLTLKISAAVALVVLLAVPAYAMFFNKGEEAKGPLAITADDIVLGDENAPVTMIEYASMTCGHCANFHNDTFKKVKENYIDTGKVKFVMRDLPWDGLAAAVVKVTRCAPDDQYYNFVSAFFSTQKSWVRSPDPVAELTKIARLGGMEPAQVEECLMNPELHNEVLRNKAIAIEELKVNSTPTFYINRDTVLHGALPYEEMAKALDKAIADAK